MMLLYSIGIALYNAGIHIASLFNSKAKAWVQGRENIFDHILAKLATDPSKKIWFHCSSFGEFEQGRPVLQQLKKQFPGYKIVLTFFSPSGYQQGFKEPAADHVFYLPIDSAGNAHKFLRIVNPAFAVFVKYDFWFHYLTALANNGVPFFFISSLFRADQYFFKWYGKTFLEKLKQASHYFVQDENSKKLLKSNGIENVTVSGDTRFDRVVQLPSLPFEDEKTKTFTDDHFVIVGGSTWPQDEKLLLDYITHTDHHLRLILVPHEINNNAIEKTIAQSALKIVRYSTCDLEDTKKAQVMIIDTIGMLSKIYRYGQLAFIGGGFGKGIHNTLEAAVYGLPVLFGPNYLKFNEAKALILNKGAWSFNNFEELKSKMDFLIADKINATAAGILNKNYVMQQAGATDKILERMKLVLSTSPNP